MSCSCKYCGSKNVYHLSRIVGYFSVVEDWNKGKTKEHEHRLKGNYVKGGLNECINGDVQAYNSGNAVSNV